MSKCIEFGKVFSKHMLRIEFIKNKGGWQKPYFSKFENLSIHPGSKVLHYAVTCFEGMKAYKGIDDNTRIFRPNLHLKRFNFSAERICLPSIDTNFLFSNIVKLIKLDSEFIPKPFEGSLYIRPTLISIDEEVEINETDNALLFVIMFKSTTCDTEKDFVLLADPSYTRACSGGVGNYKLGCNYAPTIYNLKEANKKNCKDILWLYGKEESITEIGTMSIFFFYIKKSGQLEVCTPILNDLILPSITRKSVLEILSNFKDINVIEKEINIHEVINLFKEKRLIEIFGTGTAAFIQPISGIHYKGKEYKLNNNYKKKFLYKEISETLKNIHYGVINHEWAQVI